MPPGAVRIQKLLAGAGLGSRREIESWISAGRVTLAGALVKLGDRALPGAALELDGRPLAPLGAGAPAAPRVLAYHKPLGEIVTHRDPQGRTTVFERLPPLRGAKWLAVGRLDLNTSGLLLFTDSGELAHRLMHPRHGIEREYLVRVQGTLDAEGRQRLLAGVRLADGLARLSSVEESRTAAKGGVNRWYRVTLSEGRNREVRRLLEGVGLRVSRLMRIRFGTLVLPRDLAAGSWRELDEAAVHRLLQDSASSGN